MLACFLAAIAAGLFSTLFADVKFGHDDSDGHGHDGHDHGRGHGWGHGHDHGHGGWHHSL